MRRLHVILRSCLLIGVFVCLGLLAYGYLRQRPQDVPWTDLDLAQPIGVFTGRKLAALTQDAAHCRALLDRAGVPYVALPATGSGQCHHDDAVRLQPDDGFWALAPPSVAPACPVAAALKLWEWEVVQPAAERIYGEPVRTVHHLGSYSCRKMYGRARGAMSEHATADAIDISGFTLTSGRRVTVAGDWSGQGRDAEFLRSVRDGACKLFATVLSPDYNAAHNDHFHLDQAERGALAWRVCR